MIRRLFLLALLGAVAIGEHLLKVARRRLEEELDSPKPGPTP